MFEPEYPIRTERLLLRPYAPGDVDALYAYHRLPEVAQYLETDARSRTEVEEMVARRAGSRAFTDEGQAVSLAAVLAEPAVLAKPGTLVGDCVLFWHSKRDQGGEIGYIVNPAYHGQGLATEIAAAMLRLGFEGLGLHRIQARCDARNVASYRVMERLGMRREAHILENEYLKGEWTDELVYGILRREWAARQAAG